MSIFLKKTELIKLFCDIRSLETIRLYSKLRNRGNTDIIFGNQLQQSDCTSTLGLLFEAYLLSKCTGIGKFLLSLHFCKSISKISESLLQHSKKLAIKFELMDFNYLIFDSFELFILPKKM